MVCSEDDLYLKDARVPKDLDTSIRMCTIIKCGSPSSEEVLDDARTTTLLHSGFINSQQRHSILKNQRAHFMLLERPVEAPNIPASYLH